ncbi:MAG: cobalamin-binding protein [Planctomycetota bacterium]
MSEQKQRIVSLLPSATEIVCGLGLRDQLVGVSHECNYPPGIEVLPRVTRSNVDSSASSAQIDDQVRTLVSAGQALYEVDETRLVSLQPDLILTQAQCDVCAVSYESVKGIVCGNESLRRSPLVSLNPTSISDVLEDVERIGSVAGRHEAGKAYRQALQQRINVVAQRATRLTNRPRTLVIEWTDPLMVAGNWTPDMVALAGGDYGLVTAGMHSPYVTWQQLLDFRPQVVIVAPCGFDLARSKTELVTLRQLPEWQELQLADDHVHVVDGDAFFNRPGPRLVDSLEMLSHWILGAVR